MTYNNYSQNRALPPKMMNGVTNAQLSELVSKRASSNKRGIENYSSGKVGREIQL